VNRPHMNRLHVGAVTIFTVILTGS
jgi:hypothetical protein